MAAVLIYMTARDAETAEKLGRVLVTERLAACVNVIPGMRSLYWWDGAVQRDEEAVLLAKTRSELVEPLTERVKALHDYEVPCVVAAPLTGGNPDFLEWIEAQTRVPSAS